MRHMGLVKLEKTSDILVDLISCIVLFRCMIPQCGSNCRAHDPKEIEDYHTLFLFWKHLQLQFFFYL